MSIKNEIRINKLLNMTAKNNGFAMLVVGICHSHEFIFLEKKFSDFILSHTRVGKSEKVEVEEISLKAAEKKLPLSEREVFKQFMDELNLPASKVRRIMGI